MTKDQKTLFPTEEIPIKDVFRPHFDPAQSIYDAFQDEASKRDGRSVEE